MVDTKTGPPRRAPTVEETAQDLKDGLKMVLDDAVDGTRRLSSKLEREYFIPVSSRVHAFASKNPVIFTFYLIFGVSSLIPIGCFLGFMTFCICMLLGGVALFLTMTISTLLVISTAVLFPILIFTASFALFATSSLVGLFLLTRLYILSRDNGFSLSTGFGTFVEETKARLGIANRQDDIRAPTLSEESSTRTAVIPIAVKAEETLDAPLTLALGPNPSIPIDVEKSMFDALARLSASHDPPHTSEKTDYQSTGVNGSVAGNWGAAPYKYDLEDMDFPARHGSVQVKLEGSLAD